MVQMWKSTAYGLKFENENTFIVIVVRLVGP